MEKLIKGLPVKEYIKQWRLNNPEKIKQACKKWQAEHVDTQRIKKDVYRKEHLEMFAKTARKWRKLNPEKIKATRKKYNEEHREEINKRQNEQYQRKKLEEQNNKKEL